MVCACVYACMVHMPACVLLWFVFDLCVCICMCLLCVDMRGLCVVCLYVFACIYVCVHLRVDVC